MTPSRQPSRGDIPPERQSGAGRGASAGRRRSAWSPHRGDGPPLAKPSSLPLFPLDSAEASARESESRVPPGVRRPTPAPGASRLGPASDPRAAARPASAEAVHRESTPNASKARAAGVASRCGAAFFDLLVIAAVNFLVLVLTLRLAGLDIGLAGQLRLLPLSLFLLLLDASYLVLLTAAGGQTFGKMLFGLRVVDTGGRLVSLSTATYRMVGAALSLATFGLGWLCMVFDQEGRTLHDRLTGTRVRPVSGGPERVA